MTNLFSLDVAWETDIEAALMSLPSPAIRDHDYFDRTVERVEEGLHPTENRKITLSELETWVCRCKREPSDEDQPSSPPPARRMLPNARA